MAFCQKATGSGTISGITRLTIEELAQRKDCCQRHEHWRCSSSNNGRGIVGRMEAIAPKELTPEHSQHRQVIKPIFYITIKSGPTKYIM